MNFSKNEVGGTVEILASKDFQAIPIKVTVATDTDVTLVKAGAPLTAAGLTTTGANAVGILLYDVDTAKNPNGAVVVQGVVDGTKAQAHSGVTYTDDLYSALPGVVFRTNIGTNV